MSRVNRAMLKFPLKIEEGEQVVRMPPGAVVRYCGRQNGGPHAVICMWVECPFVGTEWSADKGPVHERRFEVLTTGALFPDRTSYIGTVPIDAFGTPAALVFHIVEFVA